MTPHSTKTFQVEQSQIFIYIINIYIYIYIYIYLDRYIYYQCIWKKKTLVKWYRYTSL